MPQEKQDYLRLCNEHGLPFQEFQRTFCANCIQPECSRSRAGKSKFDARITTWEESLFLKVPRMDPSDERYRTIATQKFMAIEPNQSHTPSNWSDPRDLDAPKVISVPAPVPEPVPAPVSEAPEPVRVEPPPPVVEPPDVQDPPRIVTTQNPIVSAPVLQNTPNKPRQMIGGVEPKPAAPVLDPWQPMQPLKPGEQLVKPGARIKFGR